MGEVLELLRGDISFLCNKGDTLALLVRIVGTDVVSPTSSNIGIKYGSSSSLSSIVGVSRESDSSPFAEIGLSFPSSNANFLPFFFFLGFLTKFRVNSNEVYKNVRDLPTPFVYLQNVLGR